MDPRTKENAIKTIEKISDYNKYITQQASLGLFHVQENVRQKVPQLLKERKNVNIRNRRLTETVQDVKDAIDILEELKTVHLLPLIDMLDKFG